MEAFILGVSTGAVCVAYCGPVLVPYLLGEGKSVSQNFILLAQFLSGRLLGYLLFGIIAWGLSEAVLRRSIYGELTIGASYVLFSALLIYYGFFKARHFCARNYANQLSRKLSLLLPMFLPLAAGFITGLSFCPPFFLTFTAAVEKGSLPQSMLSFLFFFLGTSVFFLPLPLAGLLRNYSRLKIIGKMAAGLIGVYYFYSGMIMLIGGFKRT